MDDVHMSNSVHPQMTVCGMRFDPSVRRTPHRDAVTCQACLAVDAAAREAAKKPTPWGGA